VRALGKRLRRRLHPLLERHITRTTLVQQQWQAGSRRSRVLECRPVYTSVSHACFDSLFSALAIFDKRLKVDARGPPDQSVKEKRVLVSYRLGTTVSRFIASGIELLFRQCNSPTTPICFRCATWSAPSSRRPHSERMGGPRTHTRGPDQRTDSEPPRTYRARCEVPRIRDPLEARAGKQEGRRLMARAREAVRAWRSNHDIGRGRRHRNRRARYDSPCHRHLCDELARFRYWRSFWRGCRGRRPRQTF
jgi:hypothetical protein